MLQEEFEYRVNLYRHKIVARDLAARLAVVCVISFISGDKKT